MGIFELISYLEKKFSIRISHRLMDAKNFETIEIIRLKNIQSKIVDKKKYYKYRSGNPTLIFFMVSAETEIILMKVLSI